MRPGDTFLVRCESRDGVLRGARPLRYVGERSGYVVGWLPARTTCATPVLADRRDLRAVSLTERERIGRTTVLRPWRGEGILKLIPRAPAAHSIWLFWKEDRFWGWYVNLERTHTWHARGCDTRDHVLDIWCEEPRRWSWKDQDELADAVGHGLVSQRFADEVRAEGERVAGMIERWDAPFSDGCEDWRPDPEWPAPTLPDDWAS